MSEHGKTAKCDTCGIVLMESGGFIGWTFKDRPGKKYCAKDAGAILYPVSKATDIDAENYARRERSNRNFDRGDAD